MKSKFFYIVSVLFLLCGCGNRQSKSAMTEKDGGQLSKISLRQEWFPNSNYCGAVFAKEKFAKENGIELDIVQGAENVDPIKMVISGQNDFGDAGADMVIKAIAKGADLVIVGVVNVDSPTCFISKKEKNIKTPLDFINHKIGVLSGTNTESIYRALVNELGIDRKKLTEIDISFDLGTFILDKYDVRPAFVYDEPVSLDLQKIEYNIIRPKDYGISFLGTVYFTTRKMINERPKEVQAFINSIADGWRATVMYPHEAIELLKKEYDDIDSQRELLSLLKGKEYYSGRDGRILWANDTDWDGMISVLKKLGEIKDVDIRGHIDNSFLENYEQQIKEKGSRWKQ